IRVFEPSGRTYRAANYPVETTQPKRLYLDGGGKLSASPPAANGSDTVFYTGLSNVCTRSTQQFAAGGIPPQICGGHLWSPTPGPGQIAYTSEPLTAPMTLAGPIGVTIHATSNRPETIWAVTIDDIAPNGKAVELSGGALLGSLREVDTARSWPAPNGGWLLPRHPLTAASQKQVPTDAVTRYDIEVRPVFGTIAAGHRIRVRIGTGDLPHLIPPPSALPSLLGGIYGVQHSPASVSWVDLAVAK
ncbi:MAG TPA: CocE/NonD family hydrolase C-terminal non-catalytic domain-containing protein, partial [Labilithrix sp.]|nr:CocE/NonD family hydrolase C-terminal non-catalytic domain-containing protein [Labilithrix sp.]